MKKQLLMDVMTDAVEGSGIAYWAIAKNVKRDKKLNVISFEIKDIEGNGRRWIKITTKKVLAAVKKMLTDCRKYGVAPGWASQFLGDDWDYDATGIDCVIQIIAFNKVIYG